MTRVFADTSYWIALLNSRDELHGNAVALARKFASATVVTSEMVCVELLNSFSNGGPRLRRIVAQAVDALRSNARVVVWPQSTEQFRAALEQYGQVADKAWSVTDCASFQIMRVEEISAALTHDRHFGQAGFDVLLDS